MTVSKKRLLFIACLLLFGVASGISLLVAVGRQRLRDSEEEVTIPPSEPNSDSTSLLSRAEKSRASPGTDAWRNPGREWRVRVKKYSFTQWSEAIRIAYGLGENKNTVTADFTMTVRVLPLRHVGDHDIARFQLIPGDKVPKEYIDYIRGAKYVLEVDVQTGQVVELRPQKPWPSSVDTFGEEKYLGTQLWFPVDWMLRNADLAAVPSKKTYTTPTHDDQGKPSKSVKSLEAVVVPSRLSNAFAKTQQAVRIELITRYPDEYRLVQVWVPGEPWWRSFQRYYGDRLDVEAFWVEDEQEKP